MGNTPVKGTHNTTSRQTTSNNSGLGPHDTAIIILQRAIKENDCSKMLSVISDPGFDINQANTQGLTPLLLAILANNSDLVEVFLQMGADPNQYGHESFETPLQAPLELAAEIGNTKIIKKLLAHGALEPAKRNEKSFLDRIPETKSEIRKIIKAHDFTLTGNKLLRTTRLVIQFKKYRLSWHAYNIPLKQYPWLSDMIDNEQEPIVIACQKGNLEAVKALIQCGARVTTDQFGKQLTEIAKDYPDVVKELKQARENQIAIFKREYLSAYQPTRELITNAEAEAKTVIGKTLVECVKQIEAKNDSLDFQKTLQDNITAALNNKRILMPLALLSLTGKKVTIGEKEVTQENLTLFLACYIAYHYKEYDALRTLLTDVPLEKFDFNSEIPGEAGITPFWVICFASGQKEQNIGPRFDLSLLLKQTSSKKLLNSLKYDAAPTTGEQQGYSPLSFIAAEPSYLETLFSCYSLEQLAKFDWNKEAKDGTTPLWHVAYGVKLYSDNHMKEKSITPLISKDYYSVGCNGTTLIQMLSTFPYATIAKFNFDATRTADPYSVKDLLSKNEGEFGANILSVCQHLIEARKIIHLDAELATDISEEQKIEIKKKIKSSCEKITTLHQQVNSERKWKRTYSIIAVNQIRKISSECAIGLLKQLQKHKLADEKSNDSGYYNVISSTAYGIKKQYIISNTDESKAFSKASHIYSYINSGYVHNIKNTTKDVLEEGEQTTESAVSKTFYACLKIIINKKKCYNLSETPLENYVTARSPAEDDILMEKALLPLICPQEKYREEISRENLSLQLASHVAHRYGDYSHLESLLKQCPTEKFNIDHKIPKERSPLSVIVSKSSLLKLLFSRYDIQKLGQLDWIQKEPESFYDGIIKYTPLIHLKDAIQDEAEKTTGKIGNYEYKANDANRSLRKLLTTVQMLLALRENLPTRKEQMKSEIAYICDDTALTSEDFKQYALLQGQLPSFVPDSMPDVPNIIPEWHYQQRLELAKSNCVLIKTLQLQNAQLRKKSEQPEEKQDKTQNQIIHQDKHNTIFKPQTRERSVSCGDVPKTHQFKR